MQSLVLDTDMRTMTGRALAIATITGPLVPSSVLQVVSDITVIALTTSAMPLGNVFLFRCV